MTHTPDQLAKINDEIFWALDRSPEAALPMLEKVRGGEIDWCLHCFHYSLALIVGVDDLVQLCDAEELAGVNSQCFTPVEKLLSDAYVTLGQTPATSEPLAILERAIVGWIAEHKVTM